MDKETIKAAVYALEHEIEKKKEVLSLLEGNLWSYRQLCPHGEWQDAGRDSHYSYKKCGICGKEIKE